MRNSACNKKNARHPWTIKSSRNEAVWFPRDQTDMGLGVLGVTHYWGWLAWHQTQDIRTKKCTSQYQQSKIHQLCEIASSPIVIKLLVSHLDSSHGNTVSHILYTNGPGHFQWVFRHQPYHTYHTLSSAWYSGKPLPRVILPLGCGTRYQLEDR
jgi:hypothetical protein